MQKKKRKQGLIVMLTAKNSLLATMTLRLGSGGRGRADAQSRVALVTVLMMNSIPVIQTGSYFLGREAA